MKKLVGILLALIMVLSGFALSEEVQAKIVPEDQYVLVAFVDELGETSSYALIGNGDGKDAFEIFAPKEATYEKRYDAFWDALTMLQPALTVEGGIDSLEFVMSEDQKMINVMFNGELLIELENAESFIILSDKTLLMPIIGEDCAVNVWNETGIVSFTEEAPEGESVKLCKHCGQIDDGSSKHKTVISKFCKEGHTLCMGDPTHHCDSCGKDYLCSQSNSHTKCTVCGEAWCYKKHGDHKELACGHRGCEVYGHEDAHKKCDICGKYLCNGKDHTAADCGVHHASEAGDHTAAACGIAGHFNCDGKDHTAGACGAAGHANCDGKDHNPGACGVAGHANCDGKDHNVGACGVAGHANCDGKDHNPGACGVAGHANCDGMDHNAGACGVAGHANCDGKDHNPGACGIAGHYNCDGLNHTDGSCAPV